jgi:hypothetical protein
MSGISSSYFSQIDVVHGLALTPFMKPSDCLDLKCPKAIDPIALHYRVFWDRDFLELEGDLT